MEKIYNKLVRDNIPDIIIENGGESITRVLGDTEYKKELENKLFEEYNEVLNAKGQDRVEELADMLEVIQALAKLEEVTLKDVVDLAEQKRNKRGAFNDRIFLEKVIE